MLVVQSQAGLLFSGSSTTEHMRINSNGNVGIGTNAPGSVLHVHSQDSRSLRFTRAGMGGLWGFEIAGNEFGLYDFTNAKYIWRHSASDLLLMESSGNVGIGKTAPAYKLDVEGDIVRFKNSSTAASTYTSLRVQGGTSFANGLEIDFFGSPNIPSQAWTYNAGVGGASVVNVNPNPLVLGTANQGRIFIMGDGKVGIGTFTPDSFQLAVEGAIGARSVKVTNVTPWPDFVFANSYHLRPLSEVESYIQANQHLPEVPSATEVAKDGINLGEMDALLLKKIEELTLYMIDLKKENEVLKKENEQIKARVKKLE